MSEENKVIKAGIGYTIGNYLLKGLSFLTVPLFSRLLDTSDYGIFNTYLAYQGIMFLLVGIALHTSLKMRNTGTKKNLTGITPTVFW